MNLTYTLNDINSYITEVKENENDFLLMMDDIVNQYDQEAKEKVNWLINQDIEASYGDAEDIHFWESINLSQIELVLLALPSVRDAITITKQLRAAHYNGKIAAVARYDDERTKLEDCSIDKVFNFYTEAGVGFAEESLALLSNGKG